MTTLQLLKHKRSQLLEIATKHGVTSIRVFGSAARQEDSPDSDVDFLVSVGPKTSSGFPSGLILDLESILGRRVEIITEAGLNPYIRKQVLEETMPI
jgi:predicted nucleotidyltransferase